MVFDDEELFYSHFTNQEEQQHRCMIVNNVEGHEIYLLAIDNKFISNHPGGIADCALFDESLFSFVEFKTNAEGHTTAQVEETYRNAIGPNQFAPTWGQIANRRHTGHYNANRTCSHQSTPEWGQ